MLMTSGAEGCTGSSDARNKGLQSETKMMNRFQFIRPDPTSLIEKCTVNCDSSDEGQENVEYCEDDEAKLNPEDHNLSLRERHTQPYMECMTNSDTLFNLTTSPH